MINTHKNKELILEDLLLVFALKKSAINNIFLGFPYEGLGGITQRYNNHWRTLKSSVDYALEHPNSNCAFTSYFVGKIFVVNRKVREDLMGVCAYEEVER